MSKTSGFPDSFVVPSLSIPERPYHLEDVSFRQLIPPDKILRRTGALATRMVADYAKLELDQPPLFLIVLRGALPFGLELSKQVTRLDHTLEPEIDTIEYSSYPVGSGAKVSGVMQMPKRPSAQLEGRHVVLVEDIVDQGGTVQTATRYLRAAKPASLAVASLLQRERGVRNLAQTSPTTIEATYQHPQKHTPGADPILVNYAGFDINCGYVVGHGLDLAPHGRYRSWPGVWAPDHPHFQRDYGPSQILGLHPDLAGVAKGTLISWAGTTETG